MPGKLGQNSDVISVVISKDMKAKIKDIASRDRRSMSQWIALALEDTVKSRVAKG